MTALDDVLAETDPAPARVRALLDAELERGAEQLRLPRSGIPEPVSVLVERGLRAALPVPATLRADPHEVDERAWLLVAAVVGALRHAGGGALTAGDLGGHLVLDAAASDTDAAELAVLAYEDLAVRIDRLRSRAVVVPSGTLSAAKDLRPPLGPAHPLRVAEAIAALGGNPADPAASAEHEEAVLARLAPHDAVARPHDDPVPARRVARRILQRLAGMGKWGGYHTEFSHLAKGFQGNDKHLAEDVGERLIEAGLLVEKHSVGQRHVFLNPRRAADVYALVDDGTVPNGLTLG